MKRKPTILLVILLHTAIGCGGSVPTFPVKGHIEVSPGSVEKLAASFVEFELETDTTVRGAGVIDADGEFKVKMRRQGETLTGLPEGTYRIRIILSDDVPAIKTQNAVAERFLSFETSGLSVTVPVETELTVPLANN